MINRIARRGAPAPDDPPPCGDFYVLTYVLDRAFACSGSVYVTPAVAREIERVLDRRWRPRWLVFRDRVGSRVRLPTDAVRTLVQSTAAQRARDRLLERALRLEERGDRPPWQDYD